MPHDKLLIPNHRNTNFKDNEEYKWMIVRTLPGDEQKLQTIIGMYIQDRQETNILEVYNPVKQPTGKYHDRKTNSRSLFAKHIFVLATHRALDKFISECYPLGRILYSRKINPDEKATVWTIPERQMKFFRDFNENFADNVIVLERPYADYAFNPKTNLPNPTIKVLDGPLAGRIGYLSRFRGDRRLVFKMKNPYALGETTFSIPEIWNFHCVLLHNAECDRQSLGTKKSRAVDLLLGIIQSCVHDADCIPVLHEIIEILRQKPSLANLRNRLFPFNKQLSLALAQLSAEQAALVLHLARYEQQNPGYVAQNWPYLIIRPFLTPTSGISPAEGKEYAVLHHPHFTEYILPQTFSEQTYFAREGEERTVVVTYYAHIGIKKESDGRFTVFANWDEFLGEFFHTCGRAKNVLVGGMTKTVANEDSDGKKEVERQYESFRNYTPTLYRVLTDVASPVKCRKDFSLGKRTLNVMATSAALQREEDIAASPELQTLLSTCLQICHEINTSTHLAVWRRYLQSVWLHE